MKTTTFFSYKGGAGRSTTCFNTIPFLAQEVGACKERPILLIDMDIESAGMTYLLNLDQEFHSTEARDRFDVKKLLKNELQFSSARCDIFNHPLYKEFVPVGKRLGLEDDYSVMFLGVDDASPQLNRSDISGSAQPVFTKLVDFADKNYFGAIVMDSAAGDQFSAHVALGVSDNVVFCMKMTHQFRIGTFNYLHKFATNNPAAANYINIILLPTVVANDIELDGKSQLQTSIDDIKARLSNLSNKFNSLNITTDFVTEKDNFGINEVIRFKWKEGVLYQISQTHNYQIAEDEKKAYRQYELLARCVGE